MREQLGYRVAPTGFITMKLGLVPKLESRPQRSDYLIRDRVLCRGKVLTSEVDRVLTLRGRVLLWGRVLTSEVGGVMILYVY